MTPRTTTAQLLIRTYPDTLDTVLGRDALAAIEAEAADPLRDALRGLVEAWDRMEQTNDWESQTTVEAQEKFVDALDAARRALDEVEG